MALSNDYRHSYYPLKHSTESGLFEGYSPSAPPSENVQYRLSNVRTFRCAFEGCSETFDNKFDLKKHKGTQHGFRILECSYPGCGRIFHNRDSLRQHKIHLAEPFKCDIVGCSQSFKFQRNLVRHKLMHPSLKLFPCSRSDCHRSFSTKLQLDEHEIIHNGSKDRTSLSKIDLLIHHKIRHSGVESKNLTCQLSTEPEKLQQHSLNRGTISQSLDGSFDASNHISKIEPYFYLDENQGTANDLKLAVTPSNVTTKSDTPQGEPGKPATVKPIPVSRRATVVLKRLFKCPKCLQFCFNLKSHCCIAGT